MSVQDQTLIQQISDSLLEARRTARAMSAFPGKLPNSLAEAYRVQDRSIRLWGEKTIGWKVGGVPPRLQVQFQQNWLSGPVFESFFVKADTTPVRMPVFDNGFAAVEAEFVMEFADLSDLTSAMPDAEDIIPFIANCYMGVEIASSPMPDINEIGPLAVVSDFGNNNGLILGPKVEAWTPKRLAEIEVETLVDGEMVGVARAKALPEGPLAAAAFLVGHLRQRGLPVPPGLLVSTGALTGIHDVTIGQTSTVIFKGIGEIDIEITALKPRA